MPQPVSVSIDVADLTRATEFYVQALSCKIKTRYSDIWAVVTIGGLDIHLQEKHAGTIAAAEQKRHYERHWTPVHLDFGVENVEIAMGLVKQHGGSTEGYESGEAADIGHCADPFGNGFCLIRESI